MKEKSSVVCCAKIKLKTPSETGEAIYQFSISAPLLPVVPRLLVSLIDNRQNCLVSFCAITAGSVFEYLEDCAE